ncbi:MAG TPA: hypothetical protein VK742_06745 [Candidatus Sulfotelmatobacter sp.]|jgi:hypothetical protein|nr:hypothetical protein [Candidatus Sulfotelmatobacter sp.]
MSEQQPPKHPMEKFTIAGRLLIVATICFAGGFLYWNIIYINDNFPASQYPIAFIAIPVLIGSAIFFGVFYWILRLFGIRVQKDSDDDNKSA